MKSLWHEFDRLQVQHGVLCRKWVPIHGSKIVWQIVLPRSYRRALIRSVHSGITGGHLGRSKTEEQVRRRAYWPNWREDVATEVRKCEECCRYHRGSAVKQTPLHPFFVGEPFEMISIDITGKHPRSYRGNEFIVTIVDIFTKWAEAIPVRTHTAPVVAKVLLDHIISRFGTPSKILSDQGREFESNLFQELCSKLEIHKVRSSPYTPSTNGCVERFHRTLNSMLAKVITDNQRDWDDRLSAVMAAYRSARHESTGFSPNFLVFGHENRAPIDLILGPILEESEKYKIVLMTNLLNSNFQFTRRPIRWHENISVMRPKGERLIMTNMSGPSNFKLENGFGIITPDDMSNDRQNGPRITTDPFSL